MWGYSYKSWAVGQVLTINGNSIEKCIYIFGIILLKYFSKKCLKENTLPHSVVFIM
jgi:hypothetical protein